jgi:hypothetical protein
MEKGLMILITKLHGWSRSELVSCQLREKGSLMECTSNSPTCLKQGSQCLGEYAKEEETG